jgi:calcineurin-like phosphoesterase family protein
MSKVFFTSDLHLGHRNIIHYCNRPFSSIEEMNESLVCNWNEVVSAADRVYLLGDISFLSWAPTKELIRRLKGNIHVVLGNHDHRIKEHLYELSNISSVSLLKEVWVEGRLIILCHFPMRSWNQSHRGSWHLHGHLHSPSPLSNSSGYLSLDVGVDAWNYKPASFYEIQSLLDGVSSGQGVS